jgi:hypothetical protein
LQARQLIVRFLNSEAFERPCFIAKCLSEQKPQVSDPSEVADAFDRAQQESSNAGQVIRSSDRAEKALRCFDGLPSNEKNAEWEADLHRMAICNIKGDIAKCGEDFLIGAETDGRKKMFKAACDVESGKDPEADPRTWTARAVLFFIQLFSSILRYVLVLFLIQKAV